MLQTKALLAQSHPWDVVHRLQGTNGVPLREENLPFCKSFGGELCITRQRGGCCVTSSPEIQTRCLLAMEVWTEDRENAVCFCSDVNTSDLSITA